MDRRGFTLIELSIVLVIIGLIVGGVLVGQDLIKAAEMRKFVSEIESYKVATSTFRLKYNCLPGDCANATSFFTGTANGDGNKQILYPGSAGSGEYLRAWQQLSLALLIPKNYTGVPELVQPFVRIGTNTPATPLPDTGVSIHHHPGLYTYGKIANFFFIGAERVGSYTVNGGITGGDAYAIDTKMDDGVAISGTVTSFMGPDKSSGCLNGSSAYLVVETVGNCVMTIPLGH